MILDEEVPPLLASQYRRLWLNDAHTLGLIAEILAEACGWQPNDDEILPDALELAEVAAQRIVELELQLAIMIHSRQAHEQQLQSLTYMLN